MMGITYLTDLPPKVEPAHECELPTIRTLAHRHGTFGQAPASHEGVVVRCDCGQHWQADDGWWWPITARRAKRLVRKAERRDAPKSRPRKDTAA